MTVLAPPEPTDLDVRVQRLRAPLLAELRRSPRRPQRRAGLHPARALAVAAVAIAIVATVAATMRAPSPALAVERDDGWIVLRIDDAGATARTMTRELQDAGIRGEVRLLPVAEQSVGEWAIISEHVEAPGTPRSGPSATAPPANVVRLDRVVREGRTLRVPIAEVGDATGWFVFYVGRAAQPGEELGRDGELDYAP